MTRYGKFEYSADFVHTNRSSQVTLKRPAHSHQSRVNTHPKDDVEAEYDVLEAARDLAVVPPVAAAPVVAPAAWAAARGRLWAVVAVTAVFPLLVARHLHRHRQCSVNIKGQFVCSTKVNSRICQNKSLS